jgi:hypothetical protein
MEEFKNSKVQKDLKLWYYFDELFMKLSRKDCVNFIEKGILLFTLRDWNSK